MCLLPLPVYLAKGATTIADERFQMKQITTYATGAAALLMTTSLAMADLTAEQVWEDWQASLAQYGEEIDLGTANRSGDTLMVSGVVVRATDEMTTFEVAFPEMGFRDVGDGTVAVTMGPRYDMMVTDNTDSSITPVTMRMGLEQENFEMMVSGTSEELTYDFSADSMTFSFDEFTEGDDTIELLAELVLNGVTGNYVVEPGELRRTIQTYSAEDAVVTMDIVDPGGPGQFKLNGTIDSLSGGGTGAVPTDVDMADPSALFTSGLMGDGDLILGRSSYDFEFVENGQPTTGRVTSGGSTLNVSVDEGVVDYEGEAQEMAVSVVGGNIPVPIDLEMETYGYRFAMPMTKSEEPQDFRLGLTFAGFTMNDFLWNLFDPGTVLPRDPATVSFDITGKGNWLFDLMDPDEAQAMAMSDTPGELHEMNLSNLVVDAAGARLTGDGALTFDNTDTETFNGLPRPEGEVNLTLLGGNGLIDKLVTMGLLPEDQAMGARMMMGLFAVPGEGEDVLNSKIEINDQGHVLANGQRIQ